MENGFEAEAVPLQCLGRFIKQVTGLHPQNFRDRQSGVGPQNLHSSQVPRWYSDFQWRNCTLRTTEVEDHCGFPPLKGRNRVWLFPSVAFYQELSLIMGFWIEG